MDRVRIRTFQLVASSLWVLRCPIGSETRNCQIHLLPRFPTKSANRGVGGTPIGPQTAETVWGFEPLTSLW